jgi:ABC-type branched-subunit amino acid transport system substrate-binding protein
MLAYDAVKAVVNGLNGSDGTSKSLQKKLHNTKTEFKDGSSGTIKFSGSGNRCIVPLVIQLNCKDNLCKFEFYPQQNPQQIQDPKIYCPEK